MNLFIVFKYLHLTIGAAFTLVPLSLYGDQMFQTYFFLSMPYHFTSAVFFNNSAKIWYAVENHTIKKLNPPKVYSFVPFVLSIPFFVYFYYLSSVVLSGVDLIISFSLILFSPIHAHLGILMVLLYNFSKGIPISLIISQIITLLVVLLSYSVVLEPISFIVLGILYSALCLYFVLKIVSARGENVSRDRTGFNYLAMIRPDNLFHYLLIPMLGSFDPMVLKSIKSATSFTKLAFFCWPKHVDNELNMLSIPSISKILIFCSVFALIGILLLSDLRNIYFVISIIIVIPAIIITNRFVDVSSDNNKILARSLNFIYVLASISVYVLETSLI